MQLTAMNCKVTANCLLMHVSENYAFDAKESLHDGSTYNAWFIGRCALLGFSESDPRRVPQLAIRSLLRLRN